MAAPYSSQSVSNYNANPPSDDGSATTANQTTWASVKTKIGDPLNSFASNVNTALVNGFKKLIGAAGIGATSIDYTVQGSDQGKLIKATAACTITTPDATAVGAPFSFSFLNISGSSCTVDGNGAQTVDGALTIAIPNGAGITIETDGANWFTHGQNYLGTQVQPQGRLTLTSGVPILTSDVTATTAVYYTPYVGNLVPVYNGSLFQMLTFAELTLTLQANSNYAAGAIYDVFVFTSSGVVTLGIGPAWSTATAGSGARGTGAGTTELQLLNGLWTNKNSMTARNAGSTYTVAANQGTYVGSIYMDATNGQISAHVTYGQSRKFGTWNAYQRVPIILKAGDSTSSWTPGGGPRPWNNSTANSLVIFRGLPDHLVMCRVDQNGQMTLQSGTTAGTIKTGIGFNSTSAFSGMVGENTKSWSNGGSFAETEKLPMVGAYASNPGIGINTVTGLEAFSNSATQVLYGTESGGVLTALYMG